MKQLPLIRITLSALFISEILLQGLYAFSPGIKRNLSGNVVPACVIKDRRLGVRPRPLYRDHDRNGFRNKLVPLKTDIVAIGDSQTYGTGVPRERAWPQQLAELSKLSTYNISWGTYGVTHGLLLLDDALALTPMRIIQAFYSGNDLADAYTLVYHQRSLQELKTRNQTTLNAMHDAERIETLEKKAWRLWGAADRRESARKGFLTSIKRFLSRHSRLYGLVRAIRNKVFPDLKNKETPKRQEPFQRKYAFSFMNTRCRTEFTPEYRLCALDLDDPRIKEGFRLSLEALCRMHKKAKAANTAFLVLCIPTKELVFKEEVYRALTPVPASYRTLVDNEERFWEQTKHALEKEKIPYID
ncbi:MAG: hypothetical protein KKC84_04690, partial [Candidatus Omnitrophica bacterium]|nr:hypothetical protein [Candidatus Omnitrophota bacterium]